jgi:nucleotide-binding universal stress UspA family protein
MNPLVPARTHVLVPLELPEPREVPTRLVELLAPTRILLVGWYQVPEQTPPEQAREELEETGAEALEAAARRFREAGAEVDARHVFTPDLVDTIRRLGAEEGCEAALLSWPLGELERILVVLREEVRPRTVSRLLGDLKEDDARRVTLLQISEAEADEGRSWSDRVLEAMEEEGIPTDRVETRVETADDPGRRVLEICRDDDFDVVVVPERGEMEDRLFGSFAETVVREAHVPVLVIRGGSDEGSGG